MAEDAGEVERKGALAGVQERLPADELDGALGRPSVEFTAAQDTYEEHATQQDMSKPSFDSMAQLRKSLLDNDPPLTYEQVLGELQVQRVDINWVKIIAAEPFSEYNPKLLSILPEFVTSFIRRFRQEPETPLQILNRALRDYEKSLLEIEGQVEDLLETFSRPDRTKEDLLRINKILFNTVGFAGRIQILIDKCEFPKLLEITQTLVLANGSTWVHVVADKGPQELLTKLFQKLDANQINELSKFRDLSGATWLHLAASRGFGKPLRVFIEKVSPDQLYEISKLTGNRLNLWLHWAAETGLEDELTMVVKKLGDRQLAALSLRKGNQDNTWLHIATLKGVFKPVEEMLMHKINSSEFIVILSIRNIHLLDFLQNAATNNSVEFLSRLVEGLSASMLEELATKNAVIWFGWVRTALEKDQMEVIAPLIQKQSLECNVKLFSSLLALSSGPAGLKKLCDSGLFSNKDLELIAAELSARAPYRFCEHLNLFKIADKARRLELSLQACKKGDLSIFSNRGDGTNEFMEYELADQLKFIHQAPFFLRPDEFLKEAFRHGDIPEDIRVEIAQKFVVTFEQSKFYNLSQPLRILESFDIKNKEILADLATQILLKQKRKDMKGLRFQLAPMHIPNKFLSKLYTAVSTQILGLEIGKLLGPMRSRMRLEGLCNRVKRSMEAHEFSLEEFQALEVSNPIKLLMVIPACWGDGGIPLVEIAKRFSKFRRVLKNQGTGLENKVLDFMRILDEVTISNLEKCQMLMRISVGEEGLTLEDAQKEFSEELDKIKILSAGGLMTNDNCRAILADEGRVAELLKEAREKLLGASDNEVLEEEFNKTFGAERICTALFEYFSSLKECGDSYVETYQSLLDSIIRGKWPRMRYNIVESEHLKIIHDKHPAIFERWQHAGEDTILENGHRVTVSDDWQDLLLCGTEVDGSCLSVKGDPEYNRCVLGQLLDGKCKLFLVRDDEGKIVSRRFGRLLIEAGTEKPVLFLERSYGDENLVNGEDVIISHAANYAKSLGIPMVMDIGTDSGVGTVEYLGEGLESISMPIDTDGSTLPQYVDGLESIIDGTYSLLPARLGVYTSDE